MQKGRVKIHNHKFIGKICIIELQYRDKTISAYTIIDKEDAEKVLARRWSLEKEKGYVSSRLNGSTIKLHNFVFGKVGLDHINQNKLDNRKCNLRVCTTSENNHNRPLFKNNKSGIKGVCKYIDTNGAVRYHSSIIIRGKVYQKNCSTKKQAIIQRKEWEKLL